MAEYRKFKGKHLVILVSHIHYNHLYSCLITRGRPFDKGMLHVIESVVIRVVTSITKCTLLEGTNPAPPVEIHFLKSLYD